jgi:hypothetical protein
VFSAFLSRRAVPATPEERDGALAEHPSHRVRPSPDFEGLGLPGSVTGLHLGSLHATARRLAAAGLHPSGILAPLLLDASRRHAGDRATLLLSVS